MSLILDVRLDGFSNLAGSLMRDDNGAIQFAYSKAHLDNPNAQPLSLSLPLTDEPYGDVLARPFFQNLMQERDGTLERIRVREGLAVDDVVGILSHIGKDCPGALSVVPEGAPPVKVPGDYSNDYDPLSNEQLAKILASLKQRGRLPKGSIDPSPLAGVQSKVALTLLPNEQFAVPKPGSGAPTTHILKVQDEHRCTAPKLEAATLDLSRALGFQTADAVVLELGESGDLEVLSVARFDRTIDSNGRVARLHQEDFAQALGFPPTLKYERHGSSNRRFDADAIKRILDETINPAEARDRFIGGTIFDLLTGNVDAHAKNHALIYMNGNRPQLAPRYDLIPTRLDPELTDEFPFNIGTAKTLDEINADEFKVFLSKLGVESKVAQKRTMERHATQISEELAAALDPLGNRGMKIYADLIAHNIRDLLPSLGLPVPVDAADRDAFIPKGGGWSTS